MNDTARQRFVVAFERNPHILNPAFQCLIADLRDLPGIDLQGLQYFQFGEQLFFFALALVVALLKMLGIAHFLNRIEDVFQRLLHLSELILQRRDARTGVIAAFFQRFGDIHRQRAQVIHCQHVRQQVFDHCLVEAFQANTLGLTVCAARILHGSADEKGVAAALAFFAGDALDIHWVFFAINVAADD